MKPLYKHDCDLCQYLGDHRKHDLYYCNKHGLSTLIARYGDAGEDYVSGFESTDWVLLEAKKRFRETIMRGLVPNTI